MKVLRMSYARLAYWVGLEARSEAFGLPGHPSTPAVASEIRAARQDKQCPMHSEDLMTQHACYDIIPGCVHHGPPLTLIAM